MAPKSASQSAIRRREFLKAAGLAALIPAPGARHIRGAKDKVNLAFIGLGRRGSANLGHAAQVPGIRIMAVCEMNWPGPGRTTRTTANGHCCEILADRSIDAVSIAVPGARAPQLIIQACQSGKHVYVETPVFVKLDEGQPIVDAARQCHRVVQAGTPLRSGVAFQKARELINSGELGAVRFCRITAANDPMPVIDLVQFLFDEVAPVSIDGQPGAVTFHYPDFIASYRSLPGPWGVSIHGTRATLAVNRAGYSLFPGGRGRVAVEDCGGPPQVAHWKNFLECIRTGRPPAGDIEACVRSTTACLRAGLAMRHNWMPV